MRLITKLWATLLLLCVAGVANAATEYEIDQKFTTLAELDGKRLSVQISNAGELLVDLIRLCGICNTCHT